MIIIIMTCKCMTAHDSDHSRWRAVVQLVERWTSDQNRSNPILEATLRNNLRQVVHTYVPLSPSSISNWYRPKGGDALHAAGEVTVGLAESNGSLLLGG